MSCHVVSSSDVNADVHVYMFMLLGSYRNSRPPSRSRILHLPQPSRRIRSPPLLDFRRTWRVIPTTTKHPPHHRIQGEISGYRARAQGVA